MPHLLRCNITSRQKADAVVSAESFWVWPARIPLIALIVTSACRQYAVSSTDPSLQDSCDRSLLYISLASRKLPPVLKVDPANNSRHMKAKCKTPLTARRFSDFSSDKSSGFSSCICMSICEAPLNRLPEQSTMDTIHTFMATSASLPCRQTGIITNMRKDSTPRAGVFAFSSIGLAVGSYKKIK